MDRFYEFCKYSAWKVGISFSGGADSTVLLDLFCKFWEANKEEHGNAPLLVAYANTSNEFATMPGHVRAFCAYMQLKYDIEIDLRIVKAKENFFDVCKDIGYPVASKKVAGMVSGIRADLKRLNIDWKDIEYKFNYARKVCHSIS
jgi:3'-phosphoadenosine 5'-phosphosulfate sulfotransferase (PAPS reductase)/FAD synthetase